MISSANEWLSKNELIETYELSVCLASTELKCSVFMQIG